MENYYSILELPRTATFNEIKNAYKKLSLKYHPDKQETGAESEFSDFVKLSQAYKILSDPDSRQQYDKKLTNLESFQCLPIDQDILIGDMNYDRDSETYSKVCRCGGEYSLSTSELEMESGDFQIYCDSCSLCIKIITATKSSEETENKLIDCKR